MDMETPPRDEKNTGEIRGEDLQVAAVVVAASVAV